jgi:hypothetical protein
VDGHVAAAQLDAGQVHRVLDDLRACAAWRCGSLRFTKARMRWMIWPARSAWRAVFCSAATRSSLAMESAARARHHAVAVVGDGRQRLVQLVRHRTGHLAHRHQAAGDLGLLGLRRGLLLGLRRRAVMSVAISICARRPSVHCR